MSEAGDKTEGAPTAPAGNKKLLLVVLIFNVVIAGGLGYLVLTRQGSHAEAKKQAEAGEHEAGDAEGHASEGEAEHKGGEKGASKFGPLIEVGSFVANLVNSGPGPSRYAKVTLHVEVVNEEAKERVEAAMVPIRAEALKFFSSAKVDDVIGQDKIQGLADELLKRITVLVGKNTVRRVYFSEMVVQ